MSHRLPEVSLMQVKEEQLNAHSSKFVIEPLSPGFGLTLGNSLRRVLLSSLGGAAITSIRIDGVSHEFSTVKGVRQDVVDIILNLKQVRIKSLSDEAQVIVLDVKGPKKVTAADFKCPTGIEIINKNQLIAELTEGGKMLLEATVERGRGYVPTEMRKEEKLPIGVIAIDSAFSPVIKVNFQTENTRVGKMTNFDKLILEVDTDGTVTPQTALEESAAILVEHFSVISGAQLNIVKAELPTEEVSADSEVEEIEAEKPKKRKSTK
ncbi:DNA-directed RNA polymerase subunit alpha [Candidatus Berkelbacteria bacterium]|nr:DNA-directed RNA polymerase subunit alpha [Candidatus Berkelbacteria bacterium]